MTTYWRAREVEQIAQKLILEHHDHLARTDVTIMAVFRDTIAKARGRIVLGKARKISGLNAHLVNLTSHDDLGEDISDQPVDFFVIEIAHQLWQELTPEQRIALVDHELCHLWVAIPDDPEEDRKLIILGHDLEEFEAVVQRHGLWKPDLKSFAKQASQQLSIEDLDPGEVLNRINAVEDR